MNPFKKRYSKSEIRLFNFLHQIKIFELLDYRELNLIVPMLHKRTYRKNEVIFFREDPSQALYILREGEVQLSIQIGDEFETLSFITPGKAIGETALLPNKRRVLNAVVISDSASLYVIPQLTIQELFDRNSRIKAKVFQSLSDQYSTYTANLFRAYRESSGFFQLGQVYLAQQERDTANSS